MNTGNGLKAAVSSLLVLLGKARRPPSMPVLLYHSVDETGSVISITPARFRAQMEFLRDRGYRSATLDEYLESLRTGSTGPKAVVITFDDGFRNNHTEAFPVLRSCGFTATIFLATDYLGSVCRWERHASIPELPLLSWPQIEEMHEHGIDFQAHTCSHPRMTRLSPDAMRRELESSKAMIERRLEKTVGFFCHPYGDTNLLTQEAARACGYSAAFGRLDFGLRNASRSLYDLTRVGTGRFRSEVDLEAGLLGTYQLYIALRKLVSRDADPMLG